ncbi:CRISPR system Cascade subunit CasE [Azospirillaceae bacterium]
MTDTTLYMLHLPIDARRLMEFARMHSLSGPQASADVGYLLHALFAALFGRDAPKPFAESNREASSRRASSDCLEVLSYSRHSLEALKARAEFEAEPSVYRAVDWSRAADKPMPNRFPPGMRLGFELRACPVTRSARGGGDADEKPGAERDVYELAARRAPPDQKPERSEVYRQWLQKQLADAGVELQTVEVRAMRRSPVFRRARPTQAAAAPMKNNRGFDRPDVTFSGVIKIEDADVFRARLALGVGRHRAFGFGMLMLRRA